MLFLKERKKISPIWCHHSSNECNYVY